MQKHEEKTRQEKNNNDELEVNRGGRWERSFAALRINSVRVIQMNGRYFRGNGSTAITFLTNSEIETTNPEISTARLGKPERIFYAPLFLSGIPKRIRQTQTVQIGA